MARRELAQPALGDIGGMLAGHRNKIINGDFDIWQRGTTHAVEGYGSADRWGIRLSGATMSLTRNTFAVGHSSVPGNPRYYATLACTVGNNNARLDHRIEGIRNVAGKMFTLTFWAKGTNAGGGTLYTQFGYSYGTGGSPSSADFGLVINPFVVTASWQKFSFLIAAPSLSGFTLGTADDDFAAVAFGQWTDVSTAAWTLDISHISLVEGDARLDDDAFPARHIQQEDALCKRYYEAIVIPNSACLATLQCTSTTGAIGAMLYAPKRAIPTIVIPTAFKPRNSAGTPVAVSSWASVPGIERARIVPTVASGLVAGQATDIVADGSEQTVTISAEL